MAYTWYREDGSPIHISLSGGTLTLSFAGKENLSFDGEGRLVGAWFEGVTFRRTLDNRVLVKWVEPPSGGRRHRFLADEGRKRLFVRVDALVGSVAEALDKGTLATGETPEEAVVVVRQWLHTVQGWTYKRLEEQRKDFYRIYKPVPILPPDQYLSVVLQATEGCSYNQCTFCTFYRKRPFRIKTLAQFEAHMKAVKAFLGRGLHMRRSLFLADANAVIIPQHLLLPMLEKVNDYFPVLPWGLPSQEQRQWRRAHSHFFRGIYSFISAPDALRKTVADFEAMRLRNMVRLYVGLESGHDPLRRFLRKQGQAADVCEAVRVMKAGGMHVGLIFMIGIGGDHFREAHFRDTVQLITSMPLGKGDIVYMSPFVPSARAPYVYDAAEAGIRPLTAEEIVAEEARFKAALLPWARQRGVRLSHYDIRELVY